MFVEIILCAYFC